MPTAPTDKAERTAERTLQDGATEKSASAEIASLANEVVPLRERRRLNRQRKAKLAARVVIKAEEQGAKEKARLRAFSRPLAIIGGDVNHQFPIYIPNPTKSGKEGRRARRVLIERLQAACGVAALSAHASLMVAHQGKPRRHAMSVETTERQASLSHDYLHDLGNKELQCRRIDIQDFGRLADIVFDWPTYGPLTAEASAQIQVGVLDLASRGHRRAERIIQAANEAADTCNDDRAQELLNEAFNSGPNKGAITRLELVRMAALADLNPAALWPQHAHFMAPILELARFGGKLVVAHWVGGRARLDKSLFPTALEVLHTDSEGIVTDDADTGMALALVRRLLGYGRDLDRLAEAIELQRQLDLDLILGEPRHDEI